VQVGHPALAQGIGQGAAREVGPAGVEGVGLAIGAGRPHQQGQTLEDKVVALGGVVEGALHIGGVPVGQRGFGHVLRRLQDVLKLAVGVELGVVGNLPVPLLGAAAQRGGPRDVVAQQRHHLGPQGAPHRVVRGQQVGLALGVAGEGVKDVAPHHLLAGQQRHGDVLVGVVENGGIGGQQEVSPR